ncbi:MAG TPA: sugar transferase [Gemmatimonadaceae bacterium]
MRRAKRALDLVGSGVGLVVLAPLFVVIAAAVKLDGGPVFFRQERVGRHGRPFRMWKFRTMVPDAERVGPQITARGDRRITRVGRWLRTSKLDELPQLLNVAAGEMSLVGPRPEVARYVRRYTAEQRRVLDLVPGITDPASIQYRDEERLLAQAADPERLYIDRLLPDKIRLNLEYAARASVARDVMLIAQTLARIVLPPADAPAATPTSADTRSSTRRTASPARPDR